MLTREIKRSLKYQVCFSRNLLFNWDATYDCAIKIINWYGQAEQDKMSTWEG